MRIIIIHDLWILSSRYSMTGNCATFDGRGVVILADGAPKDDAGFTIDFCQHHVQNFTADVVKINIHAVGAVFLQALAHV